jgi:hypothetical protein
LNIWKILINMLDSEQVMCYHTKIHFAVLKWSVCMTKDERPEAHEHDRQSRFVWTADQIVVLKNPDRETKGEPSPTAPQNLDPAESKPTKDDDQQDG